MRKALTDADDLQSSAGRRKQGHSPTLWQTDQLDPERSLEPISWTCTFDTPIIDPCRSDTIMDVGAWLHGLGLGQYETMFRESEIDAEVLPDLTEGDLNQLGVPLGHRKRLLKAIAALGTAETSKPLGPAPVPSPAAAERRPITVMFCDLVGSTSLAAKLDAEDWRTLVNTYLDQASASAAVTGL